jgi:hypothetical protein
MLLKKYKYVIAWYLFTTYVTFVYLSYGLSWKSFSLTPPQTVYFQNVNMEGPLTSFSSSGFGEMKNYFLRVNNGPEVMLPAAIFSPVFTGDDMGTFNPGSEVSNGQYVKVKTSGGKPIVLRLVLRAADGVEKEIIPENVASNRYLYAIKNGEAIAERYKQKSMWIVPIAVILHLFTLIFFRMKLFSKKQKMEKT